jgi:uncharacterized protein YggE
MRPVLFAALLPLLPMAAAADDAPARRITVTGSARVEAAPDLASITAGIETQGEAAASALSDNSKAMATVFDTLEKLGIAKADIQTTRISLDPVFEQMDDGRTTSRITGYQASNMITIRVRETGKLGGVVDALGAGGVNRIYGIGFDIADPRPMLEKARVEAVADAREKAEVLAQSAGAVLGEVVVIEEGDFGGGPAPKRAQFDLAPAPIAEGTVEVGTDVTVTYALD